MRDKKYRVYIFSMMLVLMSMGAMQAFSQPSDAQLKKQITSPRTVSITLGKPGTIAWSSTYKKYVWSRNFTAKLKTDTPGEFLIVKGYASYDVMGGRYVFWRTFTSSNSYEGKKSPTPAEINQALRAANLRHFHGSGNVIGEYESLRIADVPNWEWHTANSVSFYAIAVYRVINNGQSYGREPYRRPAEGMRAVDRVQEVWRVRIYREDANSPWDAVNMGVANTLKVPAANGISIDRLILLDRKDYRSDEVERLPRATKVPLITQ